MRKLLVAPPPDQTRPVTRNGIRYDYFLETSIARDFIVDLIAYSSKHAKSERTICERLIRYAIDDA